MAQGLQPAPLLRAPRRGQCRAHARAEGRIHCHNASAGPVVDFETGEIIDDAQGYGYKSQQKAAKAGWWKFKGGKGKTKNEEKTVKLWMSNNAKYVEEYENIVISNFKELPNEKELEKLLYLKTGIRIPSISYFKYFKIKF